MAASRWMVAFVGDESAMLNFSSALPGTSLRTGTAICATVWPGEKVSVPLVGVKSLGETAEPGIVV